MGFMAFYIQRVPGKNLSRNRSLFVRFSGRTLGGLRNDLGNMFIISQGSWDRRTLLLL